MCRRVYSKGAHRHLILRSSRKLFRSMHDDTQAEDFGHVLANTDTPLSNDGYSMAKLVLMRLAKVLMNTGLFRATSGLYTCEATL